jgi:cyclophilin family peptidyl-prolyl cis-trans isomerase
LSLGRRYVLSSALNGGATNSGGSQFVIITDLEGDVSVLDAAHTVFGEVLTGRETIDLIAALPVDAQQVEAGRIAASEKQRHRIS